MNPKEVDLLLLEYLTEDFEDEWVCDTAAESPQAIEAPGPKKRSGECVQINLAEEVAKLKRECFK